MQRVPRAMRTCDLCGAGDPEPVLVSNRLDGPLVRCRRCSLLYVGAREHDFTFAGQDDARSGRLAARVEQLALVRHDIEDAERPLRLAADRERLRRLLAHAPGGRLLDVGAATGTFLEAAREAFEVSGVEPDPITSAQAREAGFKVVTATLEEVSGSYDAITMLHVIEHLDSPHAALRRVHELLAPNGVVMIETPTAENPWFRLAPSRWRQLIPDHYYFFTRATLSELLRRCGFQPLEHVRVGRRVSLRFLADRLRRAGVPGAVALQAGLRHAHAERLTLRVNSGDIMLLTARRR